MIKRTSGADANGGSFDILTIVAVWNKALPVQGYNSATVRSDRCGQFIMFDQYGKLTEYGWEIDHDVPVSIGGTDAISNLQPLHWRNNRGKSDNYPYLSCTIPIR